MGLRAKLILAFALVAVMAVAVTGVLSLIAAQGAQDRLANLMLEHMTQTSAQGQAPMDGMTSMGDRLMISTMDAPARTVINNLRVTVLVSAVFAGILAMTAAALIARRLTAPLAALSIATKRLEAGERGLQLEPAGNDELGQVTKAFNSLVAGLERQETLRRDMIADVAHDLRTPIAVLRSKLEAMLDGLVSPDRSRLAALHGEVMLLGRLVEDLRTLSLAEGGGLDLRLEITKIKPLLERTLETFSARAAEAGVKLKFASVSSNLEVLLDPDRITQVLHNLIENAIRYARKGDVELGAQSAPGGVQLWVRDHGAGLSPEALERVFDRFYRGDPARVRGAGSGLGLAIARALTEAHGGRLEAANHPSGGAIFMLFLPATSTERARAPRARAN